MCLQSGRSRNLSIWSHLVEMPLIIIFFILILQFFNVAASPTHGLQLWITNSLKTAVGQNSVVKGYECGHTFFSDFEINEALRLGLSFKDYNHYYPQKYRGPLYSDSDTVEYLIQPIRKGGLVSPSIKYTHSSHCIIYTRNSKEVLDVVARIAVNEYTKCNLVDSSQTEQIPPITEETNGYQCGYKFFSDKTIQKSLDRARAKIGGKEKYPEPYVGRLYPTHLGILIWPVLDAERSMESDDAGPYFLVLSKEGKLIETIVRGHLNDFLRCSRERKIENPPASGLHSHLPVLPPSSGYQCGKRFFNDQMLKDATKLLLSTAKRRSKGQYPSIYKGKPFNEPCLIWPIFSDGSLYNKGQPGPYRIVFTLDYKIKCVAIFERGQVKVCDKRTIKGKKNHDKSDYLCLKQKITHQQLVGAADLGCERMADARSLSYPRRYEGLRFEKDGPYFTFPVFKDAIYTYSI